MLRQLGELLGSLIVISYACTILNYILKAVNKKFGKKIMENPNGKKIMTLLMKIFVKNHKYFGFATIFFLLFHFAIQFTNIGPSITGLMAASLMILQVLLGMFATIKKKKRSGVWFILHRSIAVLLLVAIGIHIL